MVCDLKEKTGLKVMSVWWLYVGTEVHTVSPYNKALWTPGVEVHSPAQGWVEALEFDFSVALLSCCFLNLAWKR